MKQSTHLSNRDVMLLLLLLAAFSASAWAYAMVVPPYENQDEIEHAEVIRHIATTGRLPVHGEAEAAGYQTRQESSQPPLYHILAAGWVRLWNLPLDAHIWRRLPPDIVACGDAATLYDKATWANDPELAAAAPAIRTLKAVRLFSILLASAGLAGLWLLARRVFPKGLVPALAVGIVAFNPQFLFISGGVNNDNLMTAIAMWGLLLAYDLWDKGPTLKRVLIMSVLAGLGGLSKLSGLGLVGLGGLAILLYAIRTRMRFWQLAGWGVLIVAPAALLMTPWLLRNDRLYGDVTALAPMLEKVGRRDFPLDWGEGRLMLLSYWAQVPCSFYPRAIYWPFFVLLGGGLAGVLLRLRRFDVPARRLLVLCAVWFAVITLAWLRWDLITPATGGRLLFPASGALALILAAGWRGWLPRSTRWWAALLPVLALVSLRAGPMAIFGRPPVVDALPEDVLAVDYVYDGILALRAYKADVRETPLRCWLETRAACGPALDLTLVWERTAPLDEDWTLVVQLVSPVPGDTLLRYNMNRWPGHGNMPTSTMPEGLIVDHYVLPLGTWDWTQAWSLQVGWTRAGQRVPLSAGGEGTTAYLDMLRVPHGAVSLPPESHPPVNAQFGDALRLNFGDVDPQEDHITLQLGWEALAHPVQDYAVFIHAYAADGTLLATADNPPRHAAFPTSLWEVGDIFAYEARLPVGRADVARVAVGLYDPATGVRLPVTCADCRIANDAVILWEQE